MACEGLFVETRRIVQHDGCSDSFIASGQPAAHHSNVAYAVKSAQDIFYFGGVDVESGGDDDFLEAVNNGDKSVVVLDGDVSGA